MNQEVAPIIEKLGDSKEYFEAEHCALPGLEKPILIMDLSYIPTKKWG